MKTNYFTFFLIVLFTTISVNLVGNALAQSGVDANIQYPVEELGGCKDQSDCKLYCNKAENEKACLDFAQKNNLMSEEEIKAARKFTGKGIKGPGGCNTKDKCEEYCNNMSHIDECVAFAEENNLLPPKELEEAKKVQAAMARGVKPPSCGNKKSCDVYCEDPSHMEECITFGAEAGFIQGKELEDAQKMLQALKKGVKPPPCKGKDACDQYCSEPDNMEVCMNFAMEAGMMSEQEKADSQKMLQALKKGVKPPKCRGKEECDTYCQQEEHFEECTNFAVAAGFMSEKDAEMARKTGGKGPGGCKGKEECESFCNNPDNQETCFNFAKDNGMIPEEDLKRMEEGKGRMKQSLEQAPSEVTDCLKNEIGEDMVEKMKSGFMPPQNIGEKMQVCFSKMGPPQGPQGSGQNCEKNPEDCKNFQPGPGEINPGGQMMPQQAGPGGCKGPDECKSYCESNPEDCKNFQQPPQGPGPNGEQNFGDRQPPQGQNFRPEVRENMRPPEGQMPPIPCQGENCQNGPPPPGDFRPPENINQTQQPPVEMMPQNQQLPQQDLQTSPQPPQEQQPPPAPPAENSPPPPPPTSFIINTDSFVGSLIYAAFKFLISH